MPGTNELRQHIAAVEQAKKITGAMEMVSSSRMRHVMSHIEYNKRYFFNLRNTMREILESSEGFEHPYLTERGERRTYIVVAGDKGLCGAYNNTVLSFALNRMGEHPGSSLITMGHMAEDYFKRRRRIPDITMLGIVQDPTTKAARRVAVELMRLFDERLTDSVHVIYTSFYGDKKNTPVEMRLLPVILHDYGDADGGHRDGMMYLPSPELVFDQLVPQYVIGLVFGFMVQAYAAENFARMNAMHSATQNAGDMIKSLQTQYNLKRQSAITNEIAELTGANEILKNERDAEKR